MNKTSLECNLFGQTVPRSLLKRLGFVNVLRT